MPTTLRTHLAVGGFPEAKRIDIRDRFPLLTGYVDLMLLRDVIEWHRVTNVAALRRLQRHLHANPAGSFSVSKFQSIAGFSTFRKPESLIVRPCSDPPTSTCVCI